MCGILGVVSRDALLQADWVKKGLNALSHRGPDATGLSISEDGKVIFGHKRLSIIDLSSVANQPMISHDKSVEIILNGEIYNYVELRKILKEHGAKFFTRSDTEVVLCAYQVWGFRFIKHIRGMFSLALFDKKLNKVLFARDRAGEKPFFYHYNGKKICFSSELNGLIQNPNISKKLNLDALDCYLLMGYVPHDLCIIEGVKKLPPAHAMIFDISTGKLKRWQYWDIPPFDNEKYSNTDQLIDDLEKLLEDSVNSCLISDVPIGVLLSGGVDSSLITALASRKVDNLKTFTVTFPRNARFDESRHAKIISEAFGTNHLELHADIMKPDIFLSVAEKFDEPIGDSSCIPTYLVTQLVKEHCKVVLGGDGGDELFGGYMHHSRLAWLDKNVRFFPKFLRTFFSYVGGGVLPDGFKGKNWVEAMGYDFDHQLPLIAKYYNQKMRKRLVPNIQNFVPFAETFIDGRAPLEQNIVQRVTRMDFKNFLPDNILVKIDKASMSNSIEMRAPFLDYRLIEFAFRKVSTEFKANSTSRKILLRKLAKKILPHEFNSERKQGFNLPLKYLLKKDPFRDLFSDVLNDSSCLFNKKITKKLFRGIDMGLNNSERLFNLVNFELWRRHHDVSL